MSESEEQRKGESELYFEAGEEQAPPPSPAGDGGGERPVRLESPPRGRRRRTVLAAEAGQRLRTTTRDRILLLDLWNRSGLPAREFADLVGVSPHTLYAWRKRFAEEGPAGLEEKRRGAPSGSRMPEATRRAVLLMKEQHPDWGVDRLHDMLLRSDGLKASAGAIALALKEEGYVTEDVPTRPHPPKKVLRFERARPNQLWQSDLFTFLLKRENRRVYLVAFLDDHSRFIVGFGLHASSSGALVREAFEAGVANYGLPEEVLTDQGPQYYTWRGKSAFTKLLEKRGVKHLVARPHRPQTLGKTERMWGTLWREFLQTAVFRGFEDARIRLGHWFDFYNFHRTHQGIGGLVPADRFFSAAPEVRGAIEARVAANAIELAKNGTPRKPFYLAGRVGEETLSLHAEGERVILTKPDGTREEVDLGAPGRRAMPGEASETPPPSRAGSANTEPPVETEPSTPDCKALPPPGTSPLDAILGELDGERETGGES